MANWKEYKRKWLQSVSMNWSGIVLPEENHNTSQGSQG
jgi:hypothetical protein